MSSSVALGRGTLRRDGGAEMHPNGRGRPSIDGKRLLLAAVRAGAARRRDAPRDPVLVVTADDFVP